LAYFEREKSCETLYFYLIAFCFRFVLRELYPFLSSPLVPVEFLMCFGRKMVVNLLQTELETWFSEKVAKKYEIFFSDFFE